MHPSSGYAGSCQSAEAEPATLPPKWTSIQPSVTQACDRLTASAASEPPSARSRRPGLRADRPRAGSFTGAAEGGGRPAIRLVASREPFTGAAERDCRGTVWGVKENITIFNNLTPHLFRNFCENFDPRPCEVRSPGQVK